MTYIPGFHLHLVEIGDQFHLQMSYTFPHSSLRTISSEAGLFTLQAEMCSTCLTTSKRLVETSPAWPSQMGPTTPDQPPWSFRLCDPQDQEDLIVFGMLRRNSP